MQSVSQGTWLFLSQRVSKWLKLDWLVVLPGICITNRLRKGLKVELKSIEAAGLRPDYLQVSTATLVLAQICCFPLEYGGPHSLPTPVLIAPVSFFSVESHELLCVVPRQKILNGVPSACEISGSLRIVCNYLKWKVEWEDTEQAGLTECRRNQPGHDCCYYCSVTKSCPTFCDPMDCSPLSSSVHGIFQARTLEWIAVSFYKVSSWPRDWAHISCIGRWIL